MPRRTLTVRKDSSHLLSTLIRSDVPWFCNFGKFVDDADFLLSKPSSSVKTTQPPCRRKSNCSNKPAALDRLVLYGNEANDNPITSLEKNEKQKNRPLRAHRRPRIASEVPLPVSKNAQFSRDQFLNKGKDHKQVDGHDDLAPSSLGEMLRRMVSFDTYGKSHNASRLRTDMGFSHPEQHSNAQEASYNSNDGSPSSFDGQSLPSFKTDSRQGKASPIEDTPSNQARRARQSRQTSKRGEASARNLGEMMRRMVSFEKYSKNHMRA